MSLLKLIKCILLDKNIVLLSSQLQAINFREYIYIKNNQSTEFKESKIIIIADNAEDKRYENINILLKNYSLKNQVINANNTLSIKLCYFLIKIKKIVFGNFNNLIIGNCFSKINQEFMNISEQIIILDDGVNIFWDDHKIKFNKKYFYFSIFNKILFKKNNYLKNNLLHLKKKMNSKKKYSREIYMIGPPHIHTNNVDQNQYALLVKKIAKKFRNRNINYIPHPKENISSIKGVKELVFVDTVLPVEHYFVKKNKIPKLIISFSSSSLTSLNTISKRFKFFNMRPKFRKIFTKKKFEKWQNNYIKELSQKGIKSYTIKV